MKIYSVQNIYRNLICCHVLKSKNSSCFYISREKINWSDFDSLFEVIRGLIKKYFEFRIFTGYVYSTYDLL